MTQPSVGMTSSPRRDRARRTPRCPLLPLLVPADELPASERAQACGVVVEREVGWEGRRWPWEVGRLLWVQPIHMEEDIATMSTWGSLEMGRTGASSLVRCCHSLGLVGSCRADLPLTSALFPDAGAYSRPTQRQPRPVSQYTIPPSAEEVEAAAAYYGDDRRTSWHSPPGSAQYHHSSPPLQSQPGLYPADGGGYFGHPQQQGYPQQQPYQLPEQHAYGGYWGAPAAAAGGTMAGLASAASISEYGSGNGGGGSGSSHNYYQQQPHPQRSSPPQQHQSSFNTAPMSAKAAEAERERQRTASAAVGGSGSDSGSGGGVIVHQDGGRVQQPGGSGHYHPQPVPEEEGEDLAPPRY